MHMAAFFMKKGLFTGLITIDIHYLVSEYPSENKKVKTTPPSIYVGGPATNAAIVFSALNGGANLISAVGGNGFRHFIDNDFNKQNITFYDLAEGTNTSPVIASVITSQATGGRNVFTHNPSSFKDGRVVEQAFQTANPDVLLLDGFYALNCAHLANKKGIPVVIDCGSWKEQYNELLPKVNYVICSEDFKPPGTETTEGIFAFLASKRIKNIAITRGSKPIQWLSEGRIKSFEVPKVNAVDTLGAGDFFHGAFCYYLDGTSSFEPALKKASKMATESCKHVGTRRWLNFIKFPS